MGEDTVAALGGTAMLLAPVAWFTTVARHRDRGRLNAFLVFVEVLAGAVALGAIAGFAVFAVMGWSPWVAGTLAPFAAVAWKPATRLIEPPPRGP